jgi:hypothetical protein
MKTHRVSACCKQKPSDGAELEKLVKKYKFKDALPLVDSLIQKLDSEG